MKGDKTYLWTTYYYMGPKTSRKWTSGLVIAKTREQANLRAKLGAGQWTFWRLARIGPCSAKSTPG
jgi:hypothetical protein